MYMSTALDAKHYTITQAAQMSGLRESTLRYYETIGIIQPIKRDVSTKRRVYRQKDIDIIDAIACLNATGMKLEDMRKYISNASQSDTDAHEQIALLKTQKARLDEEERQILLRRGYVSLKIDYWKAYERNDKPQIEQIAQKAKTLAQDLKKV